MSKEMASPRRIEGALDLVLFFLLGHVLDAGKTVMLIWAAVTSIMLLESTYSRYREESEEE